MLEAEFRDKTFTMNTWKRMPSWKTLSSKESFKIDSKHQIQLNTYRLKELQQKELEEARVIDQMKKIEED